MTPHDHQQREQQHDQDEALTPAQAQEAEASGGYVPVEAVGGIQIRIRPQKQWRMSHLRALNAGDFDTWAAGVIHPKDLETFLELDLTMAEFEEFALRAAERTGDGLGKSGRPFKSSRNRRRR